MDVMRPENLIAIDKWNVSALCRSLLIHRNVIQFLLYLYMQLKIRSIYMERLEKRRSSLKQRLPDKRNPRIKFGDKTRAR